ncbi:hypothetical protein GCM10007874_04970 [Labrys miyagiensis]|uniref:Uncharacterized protein n=1 Tax=Labrys miyagiensis TaxID=346912 RepID=A0ABQ6CCT0_9HYPH|nr:hypothetical protein [Labrys miyagiensis]GLS17482.1 hypothetical protein GCM10007874_04970 [Labrys miyagiensis]
MTIAASLRCAVTLGVVLAIGLPIAEAKPAKKIAATFLGERFPAEVAGFRYAGVKNYESQQAGGGYGARYEGPPGTWADVYVYDWARKDIPDHYNEKTSYDELALVGQAINKAVQIGAYRSATPTGSFAVPASGIPRLNCDRFLIEPKTGDARESIACVTNRNGRFVKIRLDGPKGALDLGKPGSNSINAFLKAWVSP